MTGLTHARRDGGMERSAQYLPLPLGDFAPARGRRAPLRASAIVARRCAEIVVTASVVAALIGVGLALTKPPMQVFAGARTVTIGGDALAYRGSDAISGSRLFVGDAALIIDPITADGQRAAAVTFVRGVHTTGVCHLDRIRGLVTEECTFTLGAKHFSATDVFDGRASRWHRVYSDGARAVIAVPTGSQLIPLPFLVGR